MVKRYKTFLGMIEDQRADSPALEYFDGDVRRVMTYGELAGLVSSYGAPDEGVVGIFCDNSPESVAAIFALAGKRQLVLLNPNDAPDVIRDEIRSSHVELLIGESDCDFDVAPCGAASGTDILFFTSGTTSRSKAVVLDEERLCSASYNGGSLLPLKAEDALLSVLPHSHVFGFVCSLLWPLSCGAKVCLGRGLKSVFFDFGVFRPTVTSLVPEMAGFLASRHLFNPELSLILIGAGECGDGILSMIKASGIRVSFGYGLTETSSGVALSLGDDPRAMTVCPDYKIEIAPDGEIIVISDTTLMKGYFEDEKGSAAVLDGNRLHTGDIGKLEGGYLYITGRKKEIIVLPDGTKIFLPEYEAEIARVLGAGSDFAVTRLEDGTLALFVAKPEGIDDKIDEFNLGYPRGQRISKIVYVDEIPRTATGKVMRYKLTTGE